MTEDTLLQVLQEELQQSTSWALENIRDDQVKNLQYYLGMPLGNEVKGRSQIVAWEVFEVIESSMPGFMEPFFSSDDIGKFEPRGPEDEAFADQATDYVNYIIKERNEGFLIFNTWIKDALLSKIGVVRAEWCEGEKRRKRFANLTDEQMVMLSQDADTEIIEHSAAPMPGVVGPDGQPFMQHEVVVLQKEAGCVEMECVKPECFLVSRKAASLEKSRILGEWVTYTRSELVEMGFKNAETVDSFDAASAGMLDNELNGLRDNNSTQPIKTSSVDKSLEEVRLFKGYMRCDYDGDGIAEWRRVLIGSGDDPVLENEEATEPNYAVITPIPIPHRIIGTAYADAARPLHELKTSLTRQYLDSLYQANRPRTYVNLDAKVSMDDLLNDRIGGLVRGRGPAADAIQPLQTAAVARDALEGLQLADTMRETRLGIPKFNPGLEADALHKTATGVRSINNLVDKRQKMTLRCMAETGIKRLFKTVLRLTVEYQDRAAVVRLRGNFVSVDPRGWNPDMDCSIEVGVGTSDEIETMQMLQQYAQYMQWAQNFGVVDQRNVYEFGVMLAKNSRIKGAEARLLSDPSKAPPKPPQQDPKLAIEQFKAQQEAQRFQAETALEQQKYQADAQLQMMVDKNRQEMEARQKMLEMQQQAQLAQQKAEMDAAIKQAELQFEAWKAELDNRTKLQIAGMQMAPPPAPVDLSPIFAQLQALAGHVLTAPKIVRDQTGRAVAVRKGQAVYRIQRDATGKAAGLEDAMDVESAPGDPAEDRKEGPAEDTPAEGLNS